jgi:protocatechuate 3,4-dioxygenase beta subunit
MPTWSRRGYTVDEIRRLGLHWPIMAAALFGMSLAPPAKDAGIETEPAPIEGTVIDFGGKPMGNISIDVYRAYPIPKQMESLKTDAEGKFRVPGSWATGNEYELIVRDGERIGWCNPAQQAGREKEGEKRLKIHMVPIGRTVHGTLVDVKGKPLTGVPVFVATLFNEQNRSVLFMPSTVLKGGKTNEKGEFSVVLPEGTKASLWPSDPWHIRIRIDVAADDDLGQIKVPDAAQFIGRVLDSSGKPVVGALVGAQMQNGTYLTALAGTAGGVTDTAGRYRISGIPPGKYNVTFTPPEDNIKLAAPAKEGAEADAKKETTVDLTAAEGRLVTGKVIEVDSGEPVAKCWIGYYGVARPRSSAAIIGCRSDAAGKFRFYVPPGEAYIYVSGGPGSNGFTRVAESEHTLEVPETGEIKPITLRMSLKAPIRPPGLKFETLPPKKP